MPFSAEFLTLASRSVEVKSLDSDFQIVRIFIDKAIANIAKATGAFSPRDVQIYLHGSYANNTNIYFPSEIEIAVELKQTQEFNGLSLDSDTVNYRIYNNYFVDIQLEFGPEQFRELLFNELSDMIGAKCLDKDKTIILPTVAKIKHGISIMPCFSFKYSDSIGESFNGVLLYDKSTDADIVTFPRLHSENGQAKDKACGSNFKKCVRLFKTLNALAVREFELLAENTSTGYFIECLLYNVPDYLFLGENLQDLFVKIINYLINCDLDSFACQNLVWQLFGAAREFWQIRRAEKFLTAISDLWQIFPPSRNFIA